MAESLTGVLASARVVVCVGPGGVGKTSTSAALALEGARVGRRTIVLTIDPAKRLANALGIPEIGNEEREVGAQAFTKHGMAPPSARMTAMMLDIKHAWDEVVTRYHPDVDRREKLMANRMYVALSTALAGSQEYMAMEKLYELSTREADPLDLVILDTPPATNVVDFLEAPSRMLDALDNDATKWLLEPYFNRGRITQRLFDAGSSFFVRTISRFTGAELLQELAELLAGFQGMFDGFRDRAKAVRKILADKETIFVIVSRPNASAIHGAELFRTRLLERKIRVGALVLNRAQPDVFGGVERESEPLNRAIHDLGGDDALAKRLFAVACRADETYRSEQAAAAALRAAIPEPVAIVPELARDVHDLAGLEALRGHMFSDV